MRATATLRNPARRREALSAYLFVLPAWASYLVFTLGPLLAAIYLSFTKYDVLSAPRFIGLDNYTRLFSDPRLRTVYLNTLIFVAAAVVLINGIGLVLAVLLNQRLPRPIKYILRSAYFFPSLVGLVYVSIIWQFLLQKDVGVANFYLAKLGLHRVDWLGTQTGAIASVILVDTWRNVGFAMLVFLAALQDVPAEYLEAARVDGARELQVFRKIVVPAISPAIFFMVTLTMIGASQIFETIFVLTNGGPGDSSRSVVMYLYEKGFQSYDQGYASAISITLFGIIMLLTLVQFRFRRAWVHYE